MKYFILLSVLLAGCATNNDSIECWAHGAKFSLATGEALTLPAFEPVAVYEVFVEDGNIYLEYEPA